MNGIDGFIGPQPQALVLTDSGLALWWHRGCQLFMSATSGAPRQLWLSPMDLVPGPESSPR